MSNVTHPLHAADNTGKTALITGASSGLGKSFANVFAGEGFNLALTARREGQLVDLAETLEAQYGVKVHVVPADLAEPNAAQKIYDNLSAKDVNVDILVNNAGFAVPGFYQETDWQVHQDMIQLMVTAPAQLCHLFEPGMVKRSYGRILNVASFAGLVEPSGGYTLYSGIKSCLIKFSQAHAAELEGTGVNVVALCPGFFKSELANGAEKANNTGITANLPDRAFLDIDDVALEGYDALMAAKEVVFVNGRVYRIMKMFEEGIAAKMRKAGKLSSYADRYRANTMNGEKDKKRA